MNIELKKMSKYIYIIEPQKVLEHIIKQLDIKTPLENIKNFLTMSDCQYILPVDTSLENYPIFVVRNKKIIGTLDNGEIIRLTYENIYNNSELWFLMDKWKEYITFSHKSSILYNILDYDLFDYILDF